MFSYQRLQDESKRHKKYSESESADDGHEEDESMNSSDNKENKSYYKEAEEDCCSRKINASKLSSEENDPQIKGCPSKGVLQR